jgi:phospholipase C
MPARLTRREALAGAAAAGVATSSVARALEAMAAAPRRGSIKDVEHVVILVQENRSFDHLFGTLRGVRGFGASSKAFAQPGYDAPGHDGHLLPFRFDRVDGKGECTSDVSHTWQDQHRYFNGGAMDGFVRAGGPLTMGHYTRADLPYQYALADAFTVCDRYFCSVIGPSYPNQVHLVSGWLDPDGKFGGPVVEDVKPYSLSWSTMPEQLRERGVSWKAYVAADNYTVEEVGDAPFWFFKQYRDDPELNANGIQPEYPTDFEADVAGGALPQVSWVYTPIEWAMHPPFPVSWSEYAISRVVDTLTSARLWSKTALIVTYDENGGFFDHVRPPTAPKGTKSERLTVDGQEGPIGLGFRVPTTIVSPWTRGGYVATETFDHTSVLRFLERRFGAEVPHLSAWRRHTVGDLTSAFDFTHRNLKVPELPATTLTPPTLTTGGCAGQPAVGDYPIPPNAMPAQEPGTRRRRRARRPRPRYSV